MKNKDYTAWLSATVSSQVVHEQVQLWWTSTEKVTTHQRRHCLRICCEQLLSLALHKAVGTVNHNSDKKPCDAGKQEKRLFAVIFLKPLTLLCEPCTIKRLTSSEVTAPTFRIGMGST